jgi:hypothetical protein
MTLVWLLVPKALLLNLAFFVRGVFPALGAELLHLKLVGGLSLVLVGGVERTAIAAAVQSN